jgi:hypothetical protein
MFQLAELLRVHSAQPLHKALDVVAAGAESETVGQLQTRPMKGWL